MKINIKVLFVIILIILHLIVGGFFIYLFFAINIPSIYAEIEITELTSEEIQLDTLVDISNPNPFDLFLKNIIVNTIDSHRIKDGITPNNRFQ